MSLILRHLLGNKYRLPLGYTPIAYIESTGALEFTIAKSTLPGNIKVNNTSLMYADIMSLNNTNTCILSCRASSSNGLSLWSDGYILFMGSSLQNTTVRDRIYNSRTNVCIYGNSSSGSISVSGYSSITFTGGSGSEIEADVCLFHPNGTSGNRSITRLYHFVLITNNAVLIELIPAIRLSDGVAGVYNITSNVFHAPSVGTVKPGPEVVILPDDYQQVEYIESVKDVHVDTGIHYNSFMNIEIKARLRQTYNDYMYILGAVDGNARACIRTDNNTTGNLCALLSATGTGAFTSVYGAFTLTVLAGSSNYGNNFHLIKVMKGSASNKTKVVCDSTTSTNEATRTDETSMSNSMELFSLHVNDTGHNYRNPYIMVEYVKTTLGSSTLLVHHLVPCYRKLDGKAGFYDCITNNFCEELKSSSVTENLILGPTVVLSAWMTERNLLGDSYPVILKNVYKSTDAPFASAYGSMVFLGNSSSLAKLTLPTTSGTAFSISVWAYISSVSTRCVILAIKKVKIALGMFNSEALGSTDTNSKPKITSATSNSWNHFVVTRNGSTYKIYVNGVLGTDGAQSSTLWTTTDSDNGYLGGRDTGNDSYNGRLYDFRLYNHVLTQEEVEQIYNEH